MMYDFLNQELCMNFGRCVLYLMAPDLEKELDSPLLYCISFFYKLKNISE